MAATQPQVAEPQQTHVQTPAETHKSHAKRRREWTERLRIKQKSDIRQDGQFPRGKEGQRPTRWTMGMLNDKETEEVPGSILLLSKVSKFNEPLGNAPARASVSSFPTSPTIRPASRSSSASWRRRVQPEKKMTADGTIVLEPQPDDSPNDPLNWSTWRRDAALLSLGFYCCIGGGESPSRAAPLTYFRS